MYRRLYEQQVILTPNYWLIEVYKEKDKFIAVIQNEYTDAEEERETDQVIIENGIVPNETLYHALREESHNKGITDIEDLYANRPQKCLEAGAEAKKGFVLFRVGDCISMHNIHGALYDSLRLCKDF